MTERIKPSDPKFEGIDALSRLIAIAVNSHVHSDTKDLKEPEREVIVENLKAKLAEKLLDYQMSKIFK